MVTFPVAYIAGTFPTRSETFVYREVRALRAAGWDVQTVSLNEPAERGVAELADLEAGTHVVYASTGSTFAGALVESLAHPIRAAGTMLMALRDALNPREPMPAAARAKLVGQALAGLSVARRLRKEGVRHVHCHFAHSPTTVGMYAARQLGAPFSFTGHANDLFQRRALLRRKLERAAFVACISEWHRDFYRQIVPDLSSDAAPERYAAKTPIRAAREGDPGLREYAQTRASGTAPRYEVIRCGVDVDAWTPKSDAGRAIGPSDALRVLTVCRLVEKKGVDTLVRAAAQCGRALRVTVAGDGPERQRLEALAKELGCADLFDWLGAVGNERVRELLAQTDVFVLPCRQDSSGDRDGIPVALIEAMACGVPVISGDLPAIRELIQQGETGLLIDGGRPDELAAELARIAEHPEVRELLATGGRRHVGAEFSLASTVERLCRQFLSVRRVTETGYREPVSPVPAGTSK